MQPKPMAETTRPWLPSLRVCGVMAMSFECSGAHVFRRAGKGGADLQRIEITVSFPRVSGHRSSRVRKPAFKRFGSAYIKTAPVVADARTANFLRAAEDTGSRFVAFVDGLVSVIGHADRAGPLRDYCTGLVMPCERKSVEPMAAVTAPANVGAQHQSLLHFVGEAPWSDERVLAKVLRAGRSTLYQRFIHSGAPPRMGTQ
jgi:hypothetical protein